MGRVGRGDSVRIFGTQTALDGKSGIVKSVLKSKKKYKIQMDDGGKIIVMNFDEVRQNFENRGPKKKGNKDKLPKKKGKKGGNKKTESAAANKKRNAKKKKTEPRSSKKPVAKKNRSGPDGGFKIGDNVELTDITKKPELNGKRGVIKGAFDKRKKRWPVNVKDGDAFRILKLQSINLRKLTKEEIEEINKPKPKMTSLRNELKIGDVVELYDIEKKPEYNGLTGTIAQEFDKKKRRWPVMVDSLGKVVKVEPKNVRKYERKKEEEEEKEENNSAVLNKNEITVSEETTPNFKIGDTVELHGIDKKTEYNGLLGIINGPFNETKNRWPLKLENNGKVINLQEKNIKLYEEEELGDFEHQINDGNFKVGDRVELQNVKKEEYNGLLGEITDEFDVKKCRWTITLEVNGKKIRLPPDQLKIAPEDDLASIESLDLEIDDGGFKIGDRIELIGVEKKEYNGLLGVIDEKFDIKKLFWPVQLDQGGKILNFKPNNLILYKEQKLENLNNNIQQISDLDVEESFKLVQLPSIEDAEDSISVCTLNSAILDILHDEDGDPERKRIEDEEHIIIETMMDPDDEDDDDIPTVPLNLHSAAINVALEEETPISTLPLNSTVLNSLMADERDNATIVTDEDDDIPTLGGAINSDATTNSTISTQVEEEYNEDEDVDNIPTLQTINSEVFRVAMQEHDEDNFPTLSNINSEAMIALTEDDGDEDVDNIPTLQTINSEVFRVAMQEHDENNIPTLSNINSEAMRVLTEDDGDEDVDNIPTLQTINSEVFRVAMQEHDENKIPTLSNINSEAMRALTEGEDVDIPTLQTINSDVFRVAMQEHDKDNIPTLSSINSEAMRVLTEGEDVDNIPTLQTINSEAFRVAMQEHDEDNIPTLSSINSEAMRVITEDGGLILPSNNVYSNVSDTGTENEIEIINQPKTKKEYLRNNTAVSLESFTESDINERVDSRLLEQHGRVNSNAATINEKNAAVIANLFSSERDADLRSPVSVLRKKKKHRDSIDRSRYDFTDVTYEEQRMKSAESDVSNEQVLNMFKEDAFSKSLPNVAAIDMATLANVLPTDPTPEHQRERIRIFEELDTYGQNKISRYDIEKNSHIMFGRRVVGISEAIRNSFGASKCIIPGKDPELLSFLEYETFLICLRRYFEITEAFSSCTNNSKLDYDEFRRCLPLLNRWGCVSQYPRDDFVYLVEIGEEFLDFHILRRWLLTIGLQEKMTAFVAKGENHLEVDAWLAMVCAKNQWSKDNRATFIY